MLAAFEATVTLLLHIRNIDIFELGNLTLVQHTLCLLLLWHLSGYYYCLAEGLAEVGVLALLCLEVEIDYGGVLMGVVILKSHLSCIHAGYDEPSRQPEHHTQIIRIEQIVPHKVQIVLRDEVGPRGQCSNREEHKHLKEV